MSINDKVSALNLPTEMHQAVLGLLMEEITKRENIIAQLHMLRRARYGKSSEKINHNPEQLDLFLGDIDADIAEIETALATTSTPEIDTTNKPASEASPITRKVRTRKPFPAHLPRVDHVQDIDYTDCTACGTELKRIRDEITEKLEYIPSQMIVNRYIRPQYGCPCCQSIHAQDATASVIQGSIAEPSVISHVAVAKYVDHLPLYRLESMFSRQDVEIGRSTMANWLGTIGFHLQPLVDALRTLLLQQNCLHADETPVQQLDPGKGKTLNAYLWAYRSNDLESTSRIIVFDYHDNRKGVNAQNFLTNWKGHLLIDGYSGYKALFVENPHIIELGCMAHARRKFFDLYSSNASPIASQALSYIAKLYAIEAHCKAEQMSCEQRLQYRAKHCIGLLAEYKRWLDSILLQVSPNSGLAKAIAYSVKRFTALSRYAHTGHLPIDNNPVENSIRPIAIGKKNWLFAGSKTAGQRAANLQSLFGTAKLNGIEPYAWLKHVLTVLPNTKNTPEEIKKLLPLSTFTVP